MADDRRAIVLRSASELALPSAAEGPLAGMVADALVQVEQLEVARRASPRLSILVADDDAVSARYLAELLAPSFTMTVVSDGYDALDRVLVVEFDAIVLSQSIPGMDAAALVVHLGGIRPELLDRIILVSGPTGALAVPRPELMRDDRLCLRKPVRLDQWDNAILAVLRKTKGAQYRSVESVFAL